QMIAKGHDYPDVTVVGVMAADTSLYVNDINAAERTFQLVSQVAGRAGRDKLTGHVVVQTYSPEHYAIIAASRHDYLSFYNHEIKLREIGQFSPFAHFSRYVVSHENEYSAKTDATSIMQDIKMQLENATHVKQVILMLEMTPAPYVRIRGLYRYQVLIKHYNDVYENELINILDTAQRSAKNQSTCILELYTHDII
ncbi:MAG: hypothetical protein KAQ68_08905, partial [Clostridiales bacterium]|nr:hypothetical protein [Clostridiales bacterium]